MWFRGKKCWMDGSVQSEGSADSGEITPSVIASAMRNCQHCPVTETSPSCAILVKTARLQHCNKWQWRWCNNPCWWWYLSHCISDSIERPLIAGFDGKMMVKENCPVGTGVTVMTEKDGTEFLAVFHESVINKGCSTLLISEFQVLSHGHICDSVAWLHRKADGEYGTQQMKLVTYERNYIVPLQMQGALMTVPLWKPTPNKLEMLPRDIMTSPEP